MRGKKAVKRKINPDLKYNNFQVAKFINYIMKNGKKAVAEHIVYKAFDVIENKTEQKALEVFNKAIKNVSPVLEVKSRRIGGANYQIPVQVRSDRRFILASKWIIEASRNKKSRSMIYNLADELLDASNNTGSAVKKKQDVHKVAEGNRAFAHFARY
jgi:small subunit ribosomal protein S7